MTEDVLSREERIEIFDERHVDHTEWWAEESGRVEGIVSEIIDTVRDRDDVQLAKRGTSVNRTGKHEARFQLRIAGEPWEFHGDGEERTIFRCGGCEKTYEDPVEHLQRDRCPHCGTDTEHEDTEVRTVVF